MKQFGKLSHKRFTPPKATRGGSANFETPKEAPLTGQVQNQKAAQGEERFARTLDKGQRKGLVQGYNFRWTTLKRGLPGYKELDYVVMAFNRVLAISVKGEDFVHRSAVSKNQDKINELIILAQLRKLGYDIQKVTSIPAENLKTQELADKEGKKLGLYR